MAAYNRPTEPSYSDEPTGGSFREAAQVASPPWLLGPNGARYVYSQAIQYDAIAELFRYGVLQRFPEYAQPGALAPLGRDKQIFRGITESDENYARRLRQFKRTWRYAGNAPTLLRQLWELMRPATTRIRYVVNGYIPGEPAEEASQFAVWWTCEGDAKGDPVLTKEFVEESNWNWDDSFGINPRFWIIIYRTDIVPAVWGIPPYAWGEAGLVWGSEPGGDLSWLVDAYRIIDKFKAAGSHAGAWPIYDGGVIVADASYTSAPWGAEGPFPPDAAPGYPMPNGDFADPAERPPGAIYLSGL